MTKNSRHIALNILCRVETGAYADRLLETQRNHLSDVDGNLLQHLVLGTLTYQTRLDFILSPYLKKPLHKQRPNLRNLLRLGVYQLQHLDRIPPYAIVSESVTLARKLLGAPTAKMVNAILRGVAENRKPVTFPDPNSDPVQHLAITASHPKWLVKRWINRYGVDETRALCNTNNAQPTLTIRPNALKTTPDALREQLAIDGINTEPVDPNLLAVSHVKHLFQTNAYKKGLFTVQGPGAATVIPLLDPHPGETILDMCSAPGGKTTAIAECMKDRGRILATDLYPARLKPLKQNLYRLGLTSIHPIAADARHLTLNTTFDRILVDAPCSSLGILNHHPDLRWRRRESDIHDLSHLQRTLLSRAANYLRPGGTLVYSTCTLEPEENEHIIEAFLHNHPNFYPEHASHEYPYLTLLPHHTNNDGVFAARLRCNS